MENIDSGVRTRDLVVEAEFMAIHTAQDWDYGFVVRNPQNLIGWTWLSCADQMMNGGIISHVTLVTMTILRSIGSACETLGPACLPNREPVCLMIAVEGSGWLFINDQLVFYLKLDLGHNQDVGNVECAMGLLQ